MWKNVCRGEDLYIRPNKSRANFTFDSSFPYELCIMKDYYLKLYEAEKDKIKDIGDAAEILRDIEQIESIDTSLVPPESLLREFIGGGIYEY